MKLAILTALGAMTVAQAAQAVEITGGSAEIGYSAFTSNHSASRAKMEGSLELGFTDAFALQFDLGAYKFGSDSAIGSNGTAHAVYHLNEIGSIGAFAGIDRMRGDSVNFYGAEGKFEFSGIETELYVASLDGNGASGTFGGLDVFYGFANNFGIRGKIDNIHLSDDYGDSEDYLIYSLGVDYDLSPTSVLYAEVGQVQDKDSFFGTTDTETYVGIGARINFGAGATFNRRGFLRLLPGM